MLHPYPYSTSSPLRLQPFRDFSSQYDDSFFIIRSHCQVELSLAVFALEGQIRGYSIVGWERIHIPVLELSTLCNLHIKTLVVVTTSVFFLIKDREITAPRTSTEC